MAFTMFLQHRGKFPSAALWDWEAEHHNSHSTAAKLTGARGEGSRANVENELEVLFKHCDCFTSGDFCNNCNCNNCCNNLHHEIERFKAIKACLGRDPEAFQPKIGKGQLGNVRPRHSKGGNCRRLDCLRNYCECQE
ncbi:hypothetical protein P7K49_021339, partial [Saguinus oedipus]